MDSNLKFVKLLESLGKAAEAGRIRWHETASKAAYRVVLDRGMVRIGYEDDEDGRGRRYYAVLLDNQGNSLKHRTEVSSNPLLLRNLYLLAQRDAKSIDALLDHMLVDLEAKRSS